MATILIVDDLAANRDVLATLLRSQGHRLLAASDGSSGLAAAHAERPDLVITDVLMPVMDGYELVRQLRLDPATSAIPVVFYTAHYGEREARALALSSGVSYVLKKPIESAEVLTIVGRALSGESETGVPPDALTPEFDREHLQLVTDKLSSKSGDLRTANARLRALINIGMELASERDLDRLLQSVCVAARDLFGATYVTLGVLDRHARTVQRLFTSGADDVAPWIATGDAVSGIFATVVTERKALRGDNPRADPTTLQFPEDHPAVETFLAAPVASPSQVYGWICLVGNEGRAFTENDEDLVMALSGLVGRIYENGYFAGVAQTRATELEQEVRERKLAESALRHERDRAQRYLDTAEVILLALDMNGRITLANRYACTVLGWSADELIGRDWIETCLPVRLRDAWKQKFRSLVSGDLATNENPILTRAGEERLIEWRNRVLLDGKGQAIGTFSSGTDVTERSQAVDALRAAEERMRFALEAAGVGIWEMDYATGELRWSAIIEAQHGLAPGTFPGTHAAFIERVHPQDRDALLDMLTAAKQSGADFSEQHRARWADGTVRWLTGAGRVHLGKHGEPVRGFGVSMDVSERRTLEEQYQQALKMDAIGRLAGGVAHDFNNLVTAILGYCELLLADCSEEDRRCGDIAQIQRAGASAARLTGQLLAFSRKQVIEPTLLDMNAVVSDMQVMLARLIGEDVTIVLELRPEAVPVLADRGQMEQVVMNLALNARDAMPKGGTLTIATEFAELDAQYARTHLSVEPGPYVSLTVTDTGIGITPQVQACLFEPFFTTKALGQGTGLGLSTIHGIVTQIGGSIGVQSELGKGTAFTVLLRRAKAEAIVVAPPLVERALGGPETVLVVEDAEGLLELARRLLQRQGYNVLLAANADEAMRHCEGTAAIDVLLTDVVMPGTSGLELSKQMIERRPALKVLYMSGYTDEAIVHHGILDPGIAFLHKPFTSKTLGRKIRDVLDQ